jgi:DNA-binding YbaB/EbfC family protein
MLFENIYCFTKTLMVLFFCNFLNDALMNIQQMMKQAQAMQKKMTDAKDKIEASEYTAKAGGDLVEVKISGKYKILKLNVSPTLLSSDQKDMLEDLIIAAINNASDQVEAESNGLLTNMLGKMNL